MTDRTRRNITESRKLLFNELGRSGLKHYSGTIYEEFLPHLQGERGIRVYTEMRDNSAIVGAMMFAIEALLRSVDWFVEPASESEEDVAAAVFVEECMLDMDHTWEDFIAEILSMLTYGWSYFEQVYKIRGGDNRNRARRSKFDDGRIGWRKFGIRSQDSWLNWEFDEKGELLGLVQMPPNNSLMKLPTVFIPIQKSLLFRTTSFKNNPEGRSVLRNAYRSWYFAKRIEEVEAVGLERDLVGMPIARIPIELLSAERTADQEATFNYVKDVVTRTKRDEQEGIIWPKVIDENGNDLWEFELLSSGGERTFNTGEIIQRYTQQMAMTILADFILLGHENVGSFALSSDKTELFAVALGAWLDSIAEVVNRNAIPQLFELNSFSVDELPQIRHDDIEKPDLTQLADYVLKLSQAGMPIFPNERAEERLFDLADLPPMEPEERDDMMEIQRQMEEAELENMRQPMPSFGGGGQPEDGQSDDE